MFLALSEKSFEIEAITTVSGNVDVDQTTENLVHILQLSGIKKFPKIGRGSLKPLSGKRFEARQVHGRDGLGDCRLDLPKIDIEIQDGVDLIISEVISERVDVAIATGPLTNLAKALEKEPKIAQLLKKLYIMGGALRVPGNVTKHAEFNFYCDPEAAKIVLDSKIPITLVSLDVTQKAILKKENLSGFKAIKTKLADFIYHIAGYSIDYHIEFRASDGAYIHDPLAVGLAIDEKLGEYEDLCLDITLSGEKRAGLFVRKGRSNVHFCNSVHYKRFFNLFLHRLEKMSKEVK